MRSRPTIPRLDPLDVSTLDEESRAILPSELRIFRTFVRHPKLLKRWLVFGNHVLNKSSLPARERELVILRTGWRCRAEYEFGQHRTIGLDAGLTDEEIRALVRSLDDHAWSDRDRVLLRAVDELHDDQCISDATWAALTGDWDEHQMLDIVFAVGQYTLVSMALNSCGVQREQGVPGYPD